jgi:hypothetical protein
LCFLGEGGDLVGIDFFDGFHQVFFQVEFLFLGGCVDTKLSQLLQLTEFHLNHGNYPILLSLSVVAFRPENNFFYHVFA